MYEEGNRRLSFNWGALIVKLVIIAAIVFIACWIFIRVTGNKTSSNSNSLATGNSEYITNITAMKSAAFEYFTPSKLPEKIGSTEKLTLSQMFNQKLLIDFSEDGKTCDTNSSYIQATKTADGNYALKVSLTCGEKSDFIVTTIEDEKNCNETNSCNGNTTSSDVVVDNNTNNKSNSTTSNNTKTSSTTTSSNTSSSKTNSSSSSSSSSNQYYSKPTTSSVTTTVKTTVNIKVTCSASGCCNTNCNSSNNNSNASKPEEPNNPSKTRYYKLVQWSNWEDGYSNAQNAENIKKTETTYNYCKNTKKTYYTTSYINTQSNSRTYEYELQFLDIDPSNIVAGTIGIVNSSKSYFSTTYNDYNSYIEQREKYLHMTGNSGMYNAYMTNAATFKASSLKNGNFTFAVSNIYYSGEMYRTKVTINYYNGNGVTPFYASNLGTEVYFVPLKFDVSYISKNDCIRDTAENKYKYSGYSLFDKQTNTVWQHRIPTYKWSTEQNLNGWEYTGIYEDR